MSDESSLRRCEEHEYFRAETCPVCGSDGRYLMSGDELSHVGRIMAGILRHFPEKFGLDMDEHGWIDLDELVEAIRKNRIILHWLKSHHMGAIVDTDPKGRYEIIKGRIRATYGHTVEIELDLPMDDIPERLYYPTTSEEVELLFETGLRPTDRRFVHLSKTYEQAIEAGSHREGSTIIIEIDATTAVEMGYEIKKAGKVVFITEEVPADVMSIIDRKEEEPEEAAVEEAVADEPPEPEIEEAEAPEDEPDEGEPAGD